ncbi:MAG: AbrB/MazE/SpoVT family DNA-binding domain-containing protein [Candidatus Aminicenantes bacterium]|nr:AbrB/MazE/SpoVT family DNA-binding domain-containing protein [Candidatus Aminicenantes bacterium]
MTYLNRRVILFAVKEDVLTTTVVTSKGQVVIPSRIRRKLNITKGTKLYVEEKAREIILRPITPDYFEDIAGVLPTKGKLAKVLLEERARDKNREERR